MNTSIIEKLKKLGGNTEQGDMGKSFAENWQGINFNHYLYDKEWDVYGIDQFYEENKSLYTSHKENFYAALMEHYFSDHEQTYGQDFYRNWLFTPFKKDSKDYGELDGLVDETEVRKIVQGTEMDFICIFYSYGYPDHYFVCLTDPNPMNPTVYSTDHEVFFDELEDRGNLEDFLDKYMDREEFLKVVKEYLQNKLEEYLNFRGVLFLFV